MCAYAPRRNPEFQPEARRRPLPGPFSSARRGREIGFLRRRRLWALRSFDAAPSTNARPRVPPGRREGARRIRNRQKKRRPAGGRANFQIWQRRRPVIWQRGGRRGSFFSACQLLRPAVAPTRRFAFLRAARDLAARDSRDGRADGAAPPISARKADQRSGEPGLINFWLRLLDADDFELRKRL